MFESIYVYVNYSKLSVFKKQGTICRAQLLREHVIRQQDYEEGTP